MVSGRRLFGLQYLIFTGLMRMINRVMAHRGRMLRFFALWPWHVAWALFCRWRANKKSKC